MTVDRRHVINGLDAVIDSVYAATDSDVWVDNEDINVAIKQIRKLSGDPTYRPEIYTGDLEDCVCLVLK